MCSYEEFKNFYDHKMRDCNLNQICNDDDPRNKSDL